MRRAYLLLAAPVIVAILAVSAGAASGRVRVTTPGGTLSSTVTTLGTFTGTNGQLVVDAAGDIQRLAATDLHVPR